MLSHFLSSSLLPFSLLLLLLPHIWLHQQQQPQDTTTTTSTTSPVRGYAGVTAFRTTITTRVDGTNTFMQQSHILYDKHCINSNCRTTKYNNNNDVDKYPLVFTRTTHSRSNTKCQNRVTSSTTQLDSINPLLASIEAQYEASILSSSSTSVNGPRQQQQQQTILVGGKGGVGKTTTSAALAIQLAASHPQWNVLIVSTDPAHSLGDALDIDLSSAQGRITNVNDPIITQGRLYAQEINADQALLEFQTTMNSVLDVSQLSTVMNLSPDLLNSFGISELQSLIQNPPPGLDELVALSNIFASTSKNNNHNHNSNDNSLPVFDVVVVDTAPTGHTLRLLSLPQFLNGFVEKLLKFRSQLRNVATTLQSMMTMMGGNNNNNSNKNQDNDDPNNNKNMIDTAMNRIEALYEIRRRHRTDTTRRFGNETIDSRITRGTKNSGQ
jgi:TRC40/GET3/ArsA family transport-energizing ATPase